MKCRIKLAEWVWHDCPFPECTTYEYEAVIGGERVYFIKAATGLWDFIEISDKLAKTLANNPALAIHVFGYLPTDKDEEGIIYEYECTNTGSPRDIKPVMKDLNRIERELRDAKYYINDLNKLLSKLSNEEYILSYKIPWIILEQYASDIVAKIREEEISIRICEEKPTGVWRREEGCYWDTTTVVRGKENLELLKNAILRTLQALEEIVRQLEEEKKKLEDEQKESNTNT